MKNFKISEAATAKTRAQRLVRDARAILNDKTIPAELRTALESVSNALKKKWSDLETEKKLSVGGRRSGAGSTEAAASKNASDFLVVEDPEKPSSYHLQVMKDGEPDRRLMGAAWAALHGGYRGSKYAGPNKTQAIAKLKKMYADMNIATPAESDAGPEIDDFISECGYGEPSRPYVPWGVTSFADLEQIESAEEMAADIRERTVQFTGMVENIMYSQIIPDKIGALMNLFDEFVTVLSDAIDGTDGSGDGSGNGAGMETGEVDPVVEIEPVVEPAAFAETLYSDAAVISDDFAEAETDPARAMEVDVQIIRPGWGNTRDNNYYPAEMLRTNADKFVGAKMYETDHRENEKSTRTWVSTVKQIQGFTDDGAPIARVVVHDPGFAERLRNLSVAGMIEKMECSILAQGNAKSGFELGGRRGKVVESISSVEAVDWVTRAGAGGKALSIAESDGGTAGGDPIVDPPTPDPVVSDPAPVVETVVETEPPAPVIPDPVYLSETDVAPILARLAKPIADRVRTGKYTSVEEVEKAIEIEIAYVKSLTGSGSVVLMGETRSTRREIKPSAVAETIVAVNKKYLSGG